MNHIIFIASQHQSQMRGIFEEARDGNPEEAAKMIAIFDQARAVIQQVKSPACRAAIAARLCGDFAYQGVLAKTEEGDKS